MVLQGMMMADESLDLAAENPEDDLEDSEDERDILGSIEKGLLGAFALAGALFVTAWDFVLHPNRLALALANKELNSRYARPVTYFVVTSLLTIGAFELLFMLLRQTGSGAARFPVSLPNPFEKLFIQGISSLDPKKLILAELPFLAVVGLYSYAVTRSAKRRFLDLNFEMSLSLSCYGAGSILLVYLLIIPPSTALFVGRPIESATNPLKSLPWWSWPICVFGWGILFACIRSYLVLLRSALSVTRGMTLSAWGGGLWRFFLWYYLILFWFAPMAFRLIE
jgi:hypothetical protein